MSRAKVGLIEFPSCLVQRDRSKREPTDRGPRVMHLLLNPARGGVDEHALSILTALHAEGFVPYVAGPRTLLQALAPDLLPGGVEGVVVEMSSPLDWREASRLAATLRRERIDILHCHLVVATFCGAVAARMAGVPVVIETCHGRETWREGKLIKGSFWLDRQIGRLVNRYIAVSNAVACHLREIKRIPDEKIEVIYNGRDLTRFRLPTAEESRAARAKLGLRDEQALVVLARLGEEKGHADLIDALGILASSYPRLLAMFAGTGTCEPVLRARCEAIGLANRIRFLGHRDDPESLLAAADLVVMPSLSEGMPLVAIEALAAGRPVVATAVGGTPEVIIHSLTGLLVPCGNPPAMAAAIKRVLDNPSLGAQLGRQGRRFVEQHFNVQRQIDRTVTLYRSLIGASATYAT